MKRKAVFRSISVTLSVCLGLMSTGCGATSSYVPALPKATESADIYVEPVEGIRDDFIRGVDISSVLSEEKSGVKYYDFEGNEADIFKVLADSGVNYVRVRVWNDPYDSEGNGYGGGNCDTKTAAEIGKRAAKYGMKLCVDYHYSDFWADPGKQMCPKAWEGMSVEEKSDALYAYTKESLTEIIKAGADVGMVQIGNEINNGLAGEANWENKCVLLASGSKAIREVSDKNKLDIQIAVHFTDISDADSISKIGYRLATHSIDYDIFAVSYYTYWHGSFENLHEVLQNIITKYDKKVMVAETAYSYTNAEMDGTGNSVDAGSLIPEYTASVQSQATCVRDVCAAVAEFGDYGLGVFYWEPAWIPVNEVDWNQANANDIVVKNKKAWEEFGSGWASSYAASYDPDDAGQYYGGSSWDNQAMFDATGHPLASLNVWKYLKYGTTCEPAVDFVQDIYFDLNVGDDFTMPDKVMAIYNNRALNAEAPVVWDAEELEKVDLNEMNDYIVNGLVDGDKPVTCQLHVAYLNYVQNGSFEEADRTMWKITPKGADPTDYQVKAGDAYTGSTSLHFWYETEFGFSVEQTVTDLTDGTYLMSMYAQGGDVTDATMYIYAITEDGTEYRQEFMVNGWADWQYVEIPEIKVTGGTVTIGAYMECGPKGWGTFDDFYLCHLPE